MRQFPIMIGHEGTKGPCPSSIPWDAIRPYAGQALVNHDQTLERLAERGGLDPVEAFFVMTNRTWNNVSTPVSEALEKEACAFLDGIVKDELRVERDRLLVQVHDLREAAEAALAFLQFDQPNGKGDIGRVISQLVNASNAVVQKRHDYKGLLCRDCGTPVHYPYDCPEKTSQ